MCYCEVKTETNSCGNPSPVPIEMPDRSLGEWFGQEAWEGWLRMFVAEGTAWAKVQGIVLTEALWVRSSVLLPGAIPFPYSREIGESHEIFISTYFFILQYTSLNILSPLPWKRFMSNEGSNKDNVVVFLNFYPVILGCARSSLLHVGSSCVECGLLFTVVCGLLIAVASLVELGLQPRGCSTWALLPQGTWPLPRPGIENPCPLPWWILNHWTTRKVKG